MAVGYNPRTVTDGLLLALDAGNTKSYDNPTITYVGGTSDSDNSSSFTLSGLQAGDLVLYFGAEDNQNQNTPTGASWTAIPGLVTQPDNDGAPDSAAFYVLSTGTSVTASGLPSGTNLVHVMIAFRNVDSTNPFDVNATENSASGSLPNPPSITPVTNNSMIVAVGLLDDDDVANTITPPTGYTTAVNMDSLGGATLNTGITGATIMTAYKLLATAAAEDPGAFTSSSGSAGGGEPNKGISIALRPVTNTTWTDLIGSNNGTLVNSPTFNSANGGSLNFTGTNQSVTLGTSTSFAFGTGDLSIGAWINSAANQGSFSSIVCLIDGSGGSDWQLDVTNNRPRIYVNGDVLMTTPAEDVLANNVWYHLFWTRIGSTNSLYINGNQVVTATNSENYDYGELHIGRNRSGTGLFNGLISTVSIYKGKGLTSAEVLQNYNALKGRYA